MEAHREPYLQDGSLKRGPSPLPHEFGGCSIVALISWAIARSQSPDIATVLFAANMLQHDIANHSGLPSTYRYLRTLSKLDPT